LGAFVVVVALNELQTRRDEVREASSELVQVTPLGDKKTLHRTNLNIPFQLNIYISSIVYESGILLLSFPLLSHLMKNARQLVL
jgi:hypothetical protein